MLSLGTRWSLVSTLVLRPLVIFHWIFAFAAAIRLNDLRWLRRIIRLIWLLDLFLVVFHNTYVMVRGEKNKTMPLTDVRAFAMCIPEGDPVLNFYAAQPGRRQQRYV